MVLKLWLVYIWLLSLFAVDIIYSVLVLEVLKLQVKTATKCENKYCIDLPGAEAVKSSKSDSKALILDNFHKIQCFLRSLS